MEVKITCHCPGDHGQDTITFSDRLETHAVNVIKKAVALVPQSSMRAAEVLATLSECYVIYGVTAWTIVGQNRKLLEVNPATVRLLLEHPDADLLIEAADEQYQEQVLLPLVNRASSSSPPSQTDESTSPTPLTGRKSTKRSKQSSTSTTPTDATVTTSSPPDGDSNFSPSLVSAAS